MVTSSRMLALPALLALQAVCAMSSERATGVAYYNPADGGGSELTSASGGDGGLGEPLNVIISGLSSPDVLTYDGIINFARAIGYSEECFDIHLGGPQTANLGDGNGWLNQTIELRQDYGSADVGTCLESLIGGQHFRTWTQNGADADSGAVFLASSQEEWAGESHTIVPNGYDLGRDFLVNSAVGTTSYGGVTYYTTAYNVTGLLEAGTNNINHNIAIDGIVTVLTVTIHSHGHPKGPNPFTGLLCYLFSWLFSSECGTST